MVRKKALITGITGQDGSYLAEFLLNKGYEVHGIVRRSSLFNRSRLDGIYHENELNNLKLHYGDMIDSSSISRLLEKINPLEIYNLAAQSHVGISFDIPEYTSDVDALGTLRLLDAIKDTRINTRMYQASTSELFGKTLQIPQSETTPFYPKSPYATAKLFSYWSVVNYRESYNLFASNGILFNHESPRRGENFVTRKITLSIAKIIRGELDQLTLGNLDAKRDWGYAPEYVEAMWLILQHTKPDDFIVATNEMHSVREFVELAFQEIDINIVWKGEGKDEIGIDQKSGKKYVAVDPNFYRPNEVDTLQGDYTKMKNTLGWSPKIRFKELVSIMMKAELNTGEKKLAACI